MGRTILGVVLGYVTMFAVVFLSFSAAYLAMGADRAFLPGRYEVSPLWLTISIALSVVAALAGGFVCATIARSRKAPVALAGLVVVLGILSAIAQWQSPREPSKPRDSQVANLEAMMQAREPIWLSVLQPVIGACGALGGARLRQDRRVPEPVGVA
jgi:hypothetical protein